MRDIEINEEKSNMFYFWNTKTRKKYHHFSGKKLEKIK